MCHPVTRCRDTAALQESVSFDDIAVVFSEDEWLHLDETQRSLYKQVMLDNYQMLVSVCEPTVISKIQSGHEPWMSGGWRADINSMSDVEEIPGQHVSQWNKKNIDGCLPPSAERSTWATLEKTIERTLKNRRECLQRLPGAEESANSRQGLGSSVTSVSDQPRISQPVEDSVQVHHFSTALPNKEQCRHHVRSKLNVKIIKWREQPDNLRSITRSGRESRDMSSRSVKNPNVSPTSLNEGDGHLTASSTCAGNVCRTLLQKNLQSKNISYTEKPERACVVPQSRPELTEAAESTSRAVIPDNVRSEGAAVPENSGHNICADPPIATSSGGLDLQTCPSSVQADRAPESSDVVIRQNAAVKRKKTDIHGVCSGTCEKDEKSCKKEPKRKAKIPAEVNVTFRDKVVTKTGLWVGVKSAGPHLNASVLVNPTKGEKYSTSQTAEDTPPSRTSADLKRNVRRRASNSLCMIQSPFAGDRKKPIVTYPGKRPCTCVLDTEKPEQCSDGAEGPGMVTGVITNPDLFSYNYRFPKLETIEPHSMELFSNQTASSGRGCSGSARCKRAGSRACRKQCKYNKMKLLTNKGHMCKYKGKRLGSKCKRFTKVAWVTEECGKCRKTFSMLVKKTRYRQRGRTWKTREDNVRRRNEMCVACKKRLGDSSVSSRKGPYSCSDCGKGFLQHAVLLLHQKSHTEEKLLVCPSCGKRFVQHALLILHQKTHKNKMPFQCMDCGNMFFSKSLFAEHLRSHKEEKPHRCSDCGKCFADATTLLIHQRIHTGEKPFSCKDCDKSFSQHSTLVAHQRLHTGEKPYECGYCGKRFSDRSAAACHQRTHTGDKPFKCEECGKWFSQSSHLRKHERLHTGQKPHVCTQCGKAFNEYTKLKSHENVHRKKEIAKTQSQENVQQKRESTRLQSQDNKKKESTKTQSQENVQQKKESTRLQSQDNKKKESTKTQSQENVQQKKESTRLQSQENVQRKKERKETRK